MICTVLLGMHGLLEVMMLACRVVREILIGTGIVTSDSSSDWCCVLMCMPDGVGTRDNMFAVVEVEGAIEGRYISTSEVITHPHIRVQCRSVSYDMGYSKMLQIEDVLDMITSYEIIIDDNSVLLHKTSRQTGILSSGLDATNRRYHFTLDYEIVLR